MELTDEQWKFIESFLPKPEVREDGRGRPWRDPRDVFNGILWILKIGACWKDLPERFPPYQTCHRRYQEWVKSRAPESAFKGLRPTSALQNADGRSSYSLPGYKTSITPLSGTNTMLLNH